MSKGEGGGMDRSELGKHKSRNPLHDRDVLLGSMTTVNSGFLLRYKKLLGSAPYLVALAMPLGMEEEQG